MQNYLIALILILSANTQQLPEAPQSLPVSEVKQTVEYTSEVVITPVVAELLEPEAVIESIAIENGVNPKLALYVAEYESSFNPEALGDMSRYYKGKPVRARGLWQITEAYHPEISDSEAFSVEWSTEWAMKHLKVKSSCINMWTACRNYYSS